MPRARTANMERGSEVLFSSTFTPVHDERVSMNSYVPEYSTSDLPCGETCVLHNLLTIARTD